MEVSKNLHKEHKLNQERAARMAVEHQDQEVELCTFNPIVHKLDKKVFVKVKEDDIVQGYVRRKAKSKERAELVEEQIKKTRMQIY